MTVLSPKLQRLTREELYLSERLKRAFQGSVLDRLEITKEAFTTADFPAMFANIVNANVEQKYQQLEFLWPKVAKPVKVSGFGKEKRRQLVPDVDGMIRENGGHQTGFNSLPVVPELSPYPAIEFSEAEAEMWTRKHGGRIGFSWEAWLSDQWQQIAELPDQLVEMAKFTDEINVWRVIYEQGGIGFNGVTFPASVFLADNPPLTFESLQKAVALAKANPAVGADNAGRVNTITKFALIVPPALEMTALSLLSITTMKQTDTDGNEFNVNVQWGSAIEVVPVPWANVIANDDGINNYADTGWALVPFAGAGAQRDSIISVGMSGHEAPELRIKNDTGAALGGGALTPYSGNFDNDAIEIRVRHINRAQLYDNALGFVASRGDNS